MKKYRIIYKDGGIWIPLSIMALSICDAHEWAKENIQDTGVQTTFMGGW